MIRFMCPRCQSVFDAPDDKGGKKSTCPKCGQRLRIPMPPVNKTILAPLVSAPNPPTNEGPLYVEESVHAGGDADRITENEDLIPCVTCRRFIAAEAVACPGCGAPNNWVEPEIARFLARLWDFNHIPGFRAEGKGHVLVGTARKPRQFLDMAADAVGGLGFIGSFSMRGVTQMVAAGIGREFVAEELRKAAGGREEVFVVHARGELLAWHSTNDDFWVDVMEFFGF